MEQKITTLKKFRLYASGAVLALFGALSFINFVWQIAILMSGGAMSVSTMSAAFMSLLAIGPSAAWYAIERDPI